MRSQYFMVEEGCSVYLRKNVFKSLFEAEDVDGKLYLVLHVSETLLRQFRPLNPIAEILLLNRDDYKNLIAYWPKFYGGQKMSLEDRERLAEILSSDFSFSFGKLQGEIRSSQNPLVGLAMQTNIFLEMHSESPETLSGILGISPEEITQAISDFQLNPTKILGKNFYAFAHPLKIVENFFIRTKDRRTLKMEFDAQQNFLKGMELLTEMDRRYAQ